MKLGDLHTEISSILARGSSVDSLIPAAVRRAALWIERNHTFKYMERFSEVTLGKGDNPRRVRLPSIRIKSIEVFRINVDGTFYPLKHIDPEDMASVPEELPRGFWLDGVSFAVLNATPDQEYSAEIQWTAFTEWPSDTNAENWLLMMAEDLLLAQSILMLGPVLRNDALMKMWVGMRNEALKTVLAADRALRDGGRDEAMVYTEAFGSDTWTGQ